MQDAAGRLIYANAAAARMAGYASPEAMTRDADHVIEQFELLDESGEPFPPEQLPGRQVLQGRPADEVVIQFRDPDTGHARWSIVNATPIHAPDGRLLLVVNLFRDITERKRQTDALREAMLERDRALTDLQNALRARDEFLSAASHDLKNPLATIKATAQLLMRRLDAPGEIDAERVRDGLRRVDAIATRAAGLVEELLLEAPHFPRTGWRSFSICPACRWANPWSSSGNRLTSSPSRVRSPASISKPPNGTHWSSSPRNPHCSETGMGCVWAECCPT